MADVKKHSQKLENKNAVTVDSLQQEVVGLLDEIDLLIKSTQADLDSASKSKYSRFQKQINAAGQNVADLKLRMAIVAPMKAGKSTIINAIAGQELLPNCAVAMTTIPTEIIFDSKIAESTLILSQHTQDLFNNLKQDLQAKVEAQGLEALQQSLNRYPHLLELFAKIAHGEESILEAEIVGRREIIAALNYLNHLIRIYSVIEPSKDPLAQLQDIPQINTPCLSIGKTRQSKTLGDLAIIDTPGPNEAGNGLRLTAVVEEQLRRSAIILIVLDFTQFNNDAAETIKKQIQPIVESIGVDNLYVLVNKIDQRRDGDMSSEQVKDFVLADLGLDQERHQKRIFEVAAIRAFTAAKFLLEIQQNPRIKLLEIKSLASLAKEVLGIDWDEELEDITVKIMIQKAIKLWRKSGFAPFMDSAIAELMADVAPQCFGNALNLSRNHLLAIKDDLSLRQNAISQDTLKIQSEIESLETDLNSIETCRQSLSAIAEIKIKLQQNLQNILEQLHAEAKINIEDLLLDREYQQADAIQKADINARNLLLSNVGYFELFPKWVSDNLKANVEYKLKGNISFKTEAEAEQFTQNTIAKAKERLEQLILKISENIETTVSECRHELKTFLVAETEAIVERAKNRLQTNFEVTLDLPSPIIKAEQNINPESKLIKTKSRLVDGGYEEKLVKKRAWYYWFGVIPFQSQEKIKKPLTKEDYYAVSVHEIIKQINLANNSFLDEIKKKISAYIEQDLHQQVDKFFLQLDKYLNSYLDSLQQSQSDHKLSLEERENLAKSLSILLPKTTDYIKQTDDCIRKTNEITAKVK